MRIATATTLRCPPEVTRDFIRYHRSIGIDRMYLFFDDPEPGMVVDNDDPQIKITVCNHDHYAPLRKSIGGPSPALEERTNMNAGIALNYARQEGIDWLFHIDSDEMIHVADGDVGSLFSRLPKGTEVLVLLPLEAVPDAFECDVPFLDITRFRALIRPFQSGHSGMDRYFRGAAKAWQRLLIKGVSAESALFKDEYLRGHLQGKAAVRVSIWERITKIGSHRPNSETRLKTYVSDRGRVLHYDAVRFSDWKSKWSRRRQAGGRAGLMRPNRVAQAELFAETQDTGDEGALRNLYRRLYFVEPSVFRRLERVGLARRVTKVREVLQSKGSDRADGADGGPHR